MLTLRLLGPFEVETEHGPLRLPEGQGRRLLERLLVHPGRAVAARELITALWPGTDPAAPASAQRLQAAVSRLRRLLHAAQDDPPQVTIVATGDGYRLQAPPERVDLLAFERAAADAIHATLTSGEGTDRIGEALSWWRGEPFTAFTLDGQVLAERARLHGVRRRLLEHRRRHEGGATLPDELLGTKIHHPDVRSAWLLRRSRLLRRLPAVGQQAVIAVAAPAGFGKSVLLSQWAQRQSAQVAWLRLDPGDADPARFWQGLLASIAATSPDHVTGLDTAASPASFPYRLAERIARPHRPLGIVLDDVHVLEDPSLVRQIATLVQLLPPTTTLALTSRGDLDRIVAPAFAADQVLRVTAAELSFDRGEIIRICRIGDDSADAAALDARARALEKRTDGWPLAVATLARTGAEPGAGDVIDRALGRHLVAEVLSALPDEVRVFVEATVHLDQLHPSLCDAVTGTADSRRHLAWLRDHDLLLIGPEVGGAWCRYHDLLRDELRRHVELGAAHDLRRIHLRAACWYLAHDLAEDALEHALRGRHLHVVAEQVGEILLRAAGRGEAGRCRRWVAALDPDELCDAPLSHAIGTLVAVTWADIAVAGRWSRSRQRHFGDDDLVVLHAQAIQAADEGRATVAGELTRRVLAEVDEPDAGLPPDARLALRANARSNLLLARLVGDRLSADDPLLPDIISELRPVAPTLASYQYLYWALAAFVEGRHELAASFSTEFTEGAAALGEGSDSEPGFAPTALVQALLAARRTSEPVALRSLAEPLEQSAAAYEAAGASTRVALLRAAAAHLHGLTGDERSARRLRRRADAAARSFVDAPFVTRFVDLLDREARGRADAHRGDAPAASRRLTARELDVLSLLDSALPTTAIADRLQISAHTVRSHLRSIYRKLDAHSRHDAVARARARGLLRASTPASVG